MKIIYLHGLGGSGKDWDRVVSLCPGTCLSLDQAETFSSTVERINKKLELLEEPFILCGYSLGGRLALSAAAKCLNPQLRGLVLLSTGLGYADPQERAIRRKRDRAWAQRALQNPLEFWKEWYEQDIFSSFHLLPKAHRDDWMKGRFLIDSRHLYSQLQHLSPAEHGDLTKNLISLGTKGISVLYMAGELDKKYADIAAKLGAKGVSTSILPGAGHILPLEAPELVAKHLRLLMES